MAFASHGLALGAMLTALVVRPRPGGGPDQVLVFPEEGGIHELEAGVGGEPHVLSKLDASNGVSAVAGSAGGSGATDGTGAEARCKGIHALAADGCGGVWVADDGRIRRLDSVDTRNGAVTTLPGTEAPPGWFWWGLAHNPADTGTLWAAIRKALCRVRTNGDVEGRLELVAGHLRANGSLDGSGMAARFEDIRALLPVSGGRLLIADGPDLRCMDAGGAVTTLLRGCFPSGAVRQMALLPSGERGAVTSEGSLMLISGGGFAPPSLLPTAATDRLLSLLAPPAAGEDAGGSDGGGAAVPSGTVTMRVGGRAFPVQHSVLEAGSECFARLLAPRGGFEESGAAEVALPNEDPAACAHLLSYMYGTSLGLSGASSPLLSVPPELLRACAPPRRWRGGC
ncbi:hypothetical protein HYH03_008492 [Edaphochlamys debaryana]|uniref:BTB domain-containing protein n=1 Tax=Edaphochlamys debaryana TaxID=47281 RepID=A0A836BZG7_9CHLO|nr:hypothetical protein HYH03_008492 [Edaphochlamys debaryana]|eukprot:KAG2493359.1 hypothetical protein HYH03_008492 [Edaphochlamys debaryana]